MRQAASKNDFIVIEAMAVVPRTIDHVWPIIGHFFDLGKWLNVECVAEAGDGGPGSIRRINDAIIEPMIAATPFSYSYVQTEGPMARYCYHGTVACEPAGEGSAAIKYMLIYDQAPMDAAMRVSEKLRIESRFADAVAAMQRAALA